jgi:hypothetical protein
LNTDTRRLVRAPAAQEGRGEEELHAADDQNDEGEPRLRLDGPGKRTNYAIATCACALCRAKPTSGCATGW